MIDAVGMSLGNASEQSFAQTTAFFLRLKDAIVTVDEAAGTFTFNDKIMAALAGVDKTIGEVLQSLSTERISAALASLVGTLGAVAQAVVSFSSAFLRVGEFLGPLGPWIASAVTWFTLLGGALTAMIGLPMLVFRQIMALHSGLTMLAGANVATKLASIGTWLRSIGRACLASVPGALSLGSALAGVTLAATAFVAAYKLGEWMTMGREVRELAAAQGELERATRKTEDGYRAISESTGVAITSMKDLDQAVKDGKIHYDELTGTWKAGSKEQQQATKTTASTMKQVTGEVLKAMQKQYQDYVKEVQRLQGEIVGRQRSLAAELRDMARSGMGDYSAWKDQKSEAEEYARAAKRAAAEAREAMSSGDTIAAGEKWKEAVAFADDAKNAYKQLNTEVKSGEQVVVSQQQALKTSMGGVKEAGELAINILKEQSQASKEAMALMERDAGFDNLTEGMDAAEKTWLENWKNMQSFAGEQILIVEQKLEGLVEDRHVTVWVEEKIKKATGGLIQRFARGGRLPGYGGGDRISALLEAGEFVIRKEAVAKWGAGLFHALNNLHLPEIPQRFAVGGPVGFDAAGMSGDSITVNLSFNGGQSVPVQTTKDMARQLLREFDRMGWRASA